MAITDHKLFEIIYLAENSAFGARPRVFGDFGGI
jgi:hypothetical protein